MVGTRCAVEVRVQAKQLDQQQGRRTFALIFDKGDDPKSLLTTFARDHRVAGASLTAVGGFSRAVLGYFDREQKDYRRISVDQQVEVLSMIGDVALKPDGAPEVHAHVIVGFPDGTTRGGHLMEASVWPTLEVILTDTPEPLRKQHDPATGLALISPTH